eukprot:4484560-Ditylum_brightwellii.AAC.1
MQNLTVSNRNPSQPRQSSYLPNRQSNKWSQKKNKKNRSNNNLTCPRLMIPKQTKKVLAETMYCFEIISKVDLQFIRDDYKGNNDNGDYYYYDNNNTDGKI